MEESKAVLEKSSLTFNDVLGGYITEEQAREIVSKLESDVNRDEKDDNLKATIAKLRSYYENEDVEDKKYTLKKCMLISLVTFHFLIIIGNILAVFVLPFLTPWYVSIPLISLIINLNFTPTKCPLTSLEDKLRRSMEMPEVKLFIRHYVILPYRRWKKKKRKAKSGAKN